MSHSQSSQASSQASKPVSSSDDEDEEENDETGKISTKTDQDTKIIAINNKEYLVYDKIIEDKEASTIYQMLQQGLSSTSSASGTRGKGKKAKVVDPNAPIH